MRDYSSLGLNDKLQAVDGLNATTKVYSVQYGENIEYPTNLLRGTINANAVRTDGTIIMLDVTSSSQFILNYAAETTSIRTLTLGGTAVVADGRVILRNSAGVARFSADVDELSFLGGNFILGTSTTMDISGTTAGTPTAPAANSCRLYVDVSGGKNRLMARFDTGTSLIIATEP